jgi:hypothetical protein
MARIMTACAVLALAPAVGAEESEPTEQAAVATPSPEPYVYPAPAEPPSEYPEGAWHSPAAVVDLLLVRPFMVAGLAGGSVLFVATLPFTAATFTIDDAVDALVEQADSTFRRPLGEF